MKIKEELLQLQCQIKELLSGLEAEGLEDLTTTSSIKHEIRIMPGIKPIKQRIRPIPPKKMQEFSNNIKSMVKNGIIRPCKFSAWSSPVNLVGKKDGTIRVTQDYRILNSVTVKDAYPLPNKSQIISTLGQARFFTSLDFTHGYYQIKLEESSKQYTAFACELGQFEYNRLAMGLTNPCETFQKLMNEVLDGLIGHICFVYLDDILIFSSTMQEHLEHVKLVVQRLRNHNLKVKPKKCEIAKTRIEYLSHIIENGTVRPNPKKIQAILDFKQPTSIRQLQAFNGMVSYYRKYIEQLTKIMTPLIQATTEKKLEWTRELQTAFNNCKSVFLSEKVLALPNFDLPFNVAADACEYGVGGVLSQQDPNDSTQVQVENISSKKIKRPERPIAFFSKQLNKQQIKYSATERELLAIVLTVEQFRQFLHGTHFKIYSDHQPLKYLLTADNLNPRLARWIARLKLFDYEILYRPGPENGNADAMSRLALDEPTVEDDDDTTPISINHIDVNVINIDASNVRISQLNDVNIKWIYDLKLQASKQNTDKFNDAVPSNAEQKIYYKQWDRMRIVGKNIYREFIDQADNVKYQYIVPDHQRAQVIENAHNNGHLGVDKTMERLRSKCYWPRYYEDVQDFVKSCTNCQLVKPPTAYNHAELISIKSNKPFELVCSDMMVQLPETSAGYKNILIIIDHFSKWIEIYPMRSQTAEETVEHLVNFCLRHGIPETFLSDQGRNYQSELMKAVFDRFDIKQKRTSPYHPETDGLSENSNKTIKYSLSAYVNEFGNDWDKYLPFIQFAMNTSVSKTTKCTPYQTIYGNNPRLPIDFLIEDPNIQHDFEPSEYSTNLKSLLHRTYEIIRQNKDFQVDKQKFYHDRILRQSEYTVGDKVKFLDKATKKSDAKKFKRKWKGPCDVIERTSPVNYKIKPLNGRVRIEHVNRLQKFHVYAKPLANIETITIDDDTPTKLEQEDRTSESNNNNRQAEKPNVSQGLQPNKPIGKRKRGRKPKFRNNNIVEDSSSAPQIVKQRGRPRRKPASVSHEDDNTATVIANVMPPPSHQRYNLRRRSRDQ